MFRGREQSRDPSLGYRLLTNGLGLPTSRLRIRRDIAQAGRTKTLTMCLATAPRGAKTFALGAAGQAGRPHAPGPHQWRRRTGRRTRHRRTEEHLPKTKDPHGAVEGDSGAPRYREASWRFSGSPLRGQHASETNRGNPDATAGADVRGRVGQRHKGAGNKLLKA